MTFHECCNAVLKECTGGFAEYAKAYARAGLEMRDEKEIRVQALYILNNMQHWRGDTAKRVRAVLKEIGKVKR